MEYGILHRIHCAPCTVVIKTTAAQNFQFIGPERKTRLLHKFKGATKQKNVAHGARPVHALHASPGATRTVHGKHRLALAVHSVIQVARQKPPYQASMMKRLVADGRCLFRGRVGAAAVRRENANVGANTRTQGRRDCWDNTEACRVKKVRHDLRKGTGVSHRWRTPANRMVRGEVGESPSQNLRDARRREPGSRGAKTRTPRVG